MANRRSINSPGVEIREIDLSTRATTPNGTSVFVAGFAPQGPTSEIVNVSTVSDFENIYGTPTNAAERYFYYSVKQLFTAGTNAVVNVARLPYGAGTGEGFSSKYSALVYPVIPAQTTLNSAILGAATALSAATYYYLAKPTLMELSESDYANLKQGGVTWATTAGGSSVPTFSTLNSIGNAGLVVLNEAKTTINEKFEGYYFNISDNTNLNPATDYDNARDIKTVTSSNSYTSSYSTIPTTRLAFQVSATSGSNIDSVSQTIENIPTFNIASGSGYDDTAVVTLVKVRTTPFEKNALTLNYSLQEGYTVSFYSGRTIQDVNGGQPVNNYVETVVNNTSPNLTVLVNPYLANNTNWIDASGNASKYLRVVKTTDTSAAALYGAADSLFPLGVYSQTLDVTTNKVIGDVGAKLDVVLNLAENPDTLAVDVVADAGLSTIAAISQITSLSGSTYDDTVFNSTINAELTALTNTAGTYTPTSVGTAWKSVTDKFVEFATYRRKDLVYISDPLRHVFVQGPDYKTLTDKSKNFSSNIYWPLRNMYSSYNTSYATTYGNWVKVLDNYTSKAFWAPFSAYAAAIFTRNDAVAYPWGAPAGLTRGVVTNVTDLAINPSQKQRDLLFKISVNPVVDLLNEGRVIMAQKTLLKAPSAFDRLNVRRLFLFLEKSVLNASKYFVFEPNTTFTRSRFVNTISPVFELARNTEGVYDYLLVCNENNNNSDTIDDNTLVADIYIKPTKTTEFIMVNFYCTRTSQSFQELLQ